VGGHVHEVAGVGRDADEAVRGGLGALGLEALDQVDQEMDGARVVRIPGEDAFDGVARVELDLELAAQ